MLGWPSTSFSKFTLSTGSRVQYRFPLSREVVSAHGGNDALAVNEFPGAR
jgi:hypothetical protein